MKNTSLNHVYRLVWNAVTQTWVAVAEIAKGRRKAGTSKTGAVIASVVLAAGAHADPTGGVVTSGTGNISQTPGSTVIQQQSQNLQLQWQSFNVGAGQSVTFNQPNAQALAVNQILDTNGSRILGNIHANGQVWLINPNGVYFGAGAQVNVGGLLASTLNPLGAGDDGTQGFSKPTGRIVGKVVNEGSLTATSGGYVALLGEQVINQGVISAHLGTVALGAGSAMRLNFSGNQLLSVQVDQSTLNNLASNQQLIKADGGQVFMSAGARDSFLASAVNNSGTIEAHTVQQREGRILLLSGMAAGTTTVGGTLDASAPNGGNGGFIETSGQRVDLSQPRHVTTHAPQGTTGTWLIDPNDFVIAAANGNMTGAALSADLEVNNVSISTINQGSPNGNGDIFVNDSVSWAADHTLTLSAERHIQINAPITAQGPNGKLALEFGQGSVAAGNTATYTVSAKVNLQAGDNFSTKLGSDGVVKQFKVLTSLGSQGSTSGTDLQGIEGNTAGHYVLGADIDASSTGMWDGGAGFQQIGSFSGTLDGLGHVIDGLVIDRPGTSLVALFGTGNGAVRNLGLSNASVTGLSATAGIFGRALTGAVVENTYVTGTVTGKNEVGGLIGTTEGGVTVRNTYADVSVTGDSTGPAVGGLIGYHDGTLTNSYAYGAVTNNIKGGLVGLGGSGTITSSFYNADATPSSIINGLGTAKTEAQLADPFTFIDAGWDFAGIWGKAISGGRVVLRATAGTALYDDYVKVANASKTYGEANSAITGAALTGVGASNATLTWGSAVVEKSNAGDYSYSTPNVLSVGNSVAGRTTYADLSGKLTINKKAVAVSGITAGDKAYDGNRTAAVNTANAVYTGLVAGDALTTSATGLFASKDASSTAQTVTLTATTSAGANTLLSNYTVTEQTTATARITPATLTYVADAASYFSGQAVSLSGTVLGFVGGDTLVNAVTGVSSWSAVGDLSTPGTKAVQGGGLTANAGNYVFRQAPGNATALLIKVGTPTAGLQSITQSLQLGQGSLGAGLGVSAVQPQAEPSASPSGQAGSEASAGVPPTMPALVGVGGTLKVENLGVRFPANLLISDGQ